MKAIQAALRCAKRPAVLRTIVKLYSVVSCTSGHWLGWLWPLSVGALAVAGSAVLKPHCCFQVLELSSDSVACQGSERLSSDLSLGAAASAAVS